MPCSGGLLEHKKGTFVGNPSAMLHWTPKKKERVSLAPNYGVPLSSGHPRLIFCLKVPLLRARGEDTNPELPVGRKTSYFPLKGGFKRRHPGPSYWHLNNPKPKGRCFNKNMFVPGIEARHPALQVKQPDRTTKPAAKILTNSGLPLLATCKVCLCYQVGPLDFNFLGKHGLSIEPAKG